MKRESPLQTVQAPEPNLPVTAEVIRRACGEFARSRLIVLQHLKADTEEFLDLLVEAGAQIHQVVAKPNSYVPAVLARVSSKFPVLLEEYDSLEASNRLDEVLSSAMELSKTDHRRVLVVDCGGYFARPISAMQAREAWPLAGVVEVTTFGHNRYNEIIRKVEFPVYTVARSPIKEIEARFVGAAASTALEGLLRARGRIMRGRRAVMNGFGMIGRNVAASLSASGLDVAVTDKRPYPMVDAATLGYRVGTRRQLLGEAEFLVSATAQPNAISQADFDLLPDQAYLISAGSRTNEFDVSLLRGLSTSVRQVGDHIEACSYKGKTLNLVKQGKSINFLAGSCQEEVMDLLFAEIARCLAQLVVSPPALLGVLHESTRDDVDWISEVWLRKARNVGLN